MGSKHIQKVITIRHKETIIVAVTKEELRFSFLCLYQLVIVPFSPIFEE